MKCVECGKLGAVVDFYGALFCADCFGLAMEKYFHSRQALEWAAILRRN